MSDMKLIMERFEKAMSEQMAPVGMGLKIGAMADPKKSLKDLIKKENQLYVDGLRQILSAVKGEIQRIHKSRDWPKGPDGEDSYPVVQVSKEDWSHTGGETGVHTVIPGRYFYLKDVEEYRGRRTARFQKVFSSSPIILERGDLLLSIMDIPKSATGPLGPTGAEFQEVPPEAKGDEESSRAAYQRAHTRLAGLKRQLAGFSSRAKKRIKSMGSSLTEYRTADGFVCVSTSFDFGPVELLPLSRALENHIKEYSTGKYVKGYMSQGSYDTVSFIEK